MVDVETLGTNEKLSVCKLDVSAIRSVRWSLLVLLCMLSRTSHQHQARKELIDSTMAGMWAAIRLCENPSLFPVYEYHFSHIHRSDLCRCLTLDPH